MADLHDTRDLEGLYGPLYRYSDHKRGDRITYSDYTGLHHGTILWVCPPGPVSEGGPVLSAHYVVEAEHTNWPDTVFPGQIVIDAIPTPTHNIRRGDEIEYKGMRGATLFGKAIADHVPGTTTIPVESLKTPGLIIPVQMEEIIAVHRAEPGQGSPSWEREY